MDKLFVELLKEKRTREESVKNLQEQLRCFAKEFQHNDGLCSAFLLDTSESMAGEGFRQMKKAVFDILDENIICKGPSPLEEGIDMTLSCIKDGGGRTVNLRPLKIRARVVVISDGNPTDISEQKEQLETATDSKTFQRLFSLTERQGKMNPFTFIPVGKSPNFCLLGALAAAAKGGRLLGWEEARQYARLSLNFRVASKLLSQFRGETITEDIVRTRYSNYGRGDRCDINQVCEILDEKEVYMELGNENTQQPHSSMPCFGTRVRRGRDWMYGDQDSHGVGTVIGYSNQAGWIMVEWDNGKTFDYRHGHNGLMEAYDLKVCDEPRCIPENQSISTGCLVRRGYDWQWGDQDGSEESIGIVYQVKERGEVYVRWPNGVESNYRFGYKNKYDLILCDPRDPEVMQLYRFQKEMFADEKSDKK